MSPASITVTAEAVSDENTADAAIRRAEENIIREFQSAAAASSY